MCKALGLAAPLREIQFVRVQGRSRLVSQANQVDPLPNDNTINRRLTFWISVQLCSEAERTDGDVGGDPQQEVLFEWFCRLFFEHEFTIDADERGARCL